MVLVAMALEIALHFSRVQNGVHFILLSRPQTNSSTGWKVPNEFAATSGILHYVYVNHSSTQIFFFLV